MEKVNPGIPGAAQGNGDNSKEPEQVKRVRDMIAAHDDPETRAKKAAAAKESRGKGLLLLMAKAKTLGLWISGAVKYEDGGLEDIVRSMKTPYEREIQELITRINQHHVKTIKGQEYIYSKYDGETQYHGKHDPRPELHERARKLEEEMKAKEALIRSCVLGKIRNHLVVDLDLYKEHVRTAWRPGELVKISEVIECSRQ